MTIEEIIALPATDAVKALSVVNESIPKWKDLEAEYNPKKHPVFDTAMYPDIVKKGEIEKVTRIGLGLQKLAAKRTAQLCFGIPVKRIYKTATDADKQAAGIIEKILTRNRINSVNMKRANMLFAGCEFATVWLGEEKDNALYGVPSNLRIRCKTYSQKNNDSVYPLWDDTGDLIAISFGYEKKVGDKKVQYLETFTESSFIMYKKDGSGWVEESKKEHKIGKIPAVYCQRDTPAWEDNSNIVYEMEWSLSRNGNYLRKNMKPLLVIFSDKKVKFGNEKNSNKEFRTVDQFGAGDKVEYVSWQQAIDNLKFQLMELRQQFFAQLQLPDWSFENMKTAPMSGESRKLMFIDAMLKVTEEAGDLCEALDREISVIKQFAKIIAPTLAETIDALEVENIITPYTISELKDTVNTLVNATGGKPIMSQREAIQDLGFSDDPDRTLQEIAAQEQGDVFEPTI